MMNSIISRKSMVLKKWMLGFFSMAVFFTTHAKQIPTVTGIIKSVPPGLVVTVGTPNATDTISTPVISGTADYNVMNTIRLRYDLSTDTFFLNAAKIQVKLTIDRWDNTNTPMATRAEKLDIFIDNRYGKQVIEQSLLKLTNGYKVAYTVDSVWINGTFTPVLPRYVSVEADINLNRYYDFSSSVTTAVSADTLVPLLNDCDTLYDELEFRWTPNALAEEYQVEWSFVNNYSADGTTTYGDNLLSADFKSNSTRITTYDNSYKISLLYDRGFVAFRVRAVGRNYLNPDEYIYGPWSVSNNQPVLNTLSANEYYEIPYEHEKLKNWQYSASFAEEGKKKEVINYFDGSLRNRQAVTKINSDNNIIVGETIYDYQGRAAINVMPVPLLDTCSNQNPAIRYYVKFNIDTLGNVYSKDNFDLDTSSCVSATAPMDTLIGASQYYSNNNTKMNAQQAFLPHAKKYPFSQTEYTPDNTGRIKSQSGVGKDFQLGTGKETKYFYGQPNQVQLDRLFGTEAGDASHYKKNVVVDANGQVSVTYMNQQGKTVATALAGEPPMDTVRNAPRLDSLESANANQKTLTVDLFNKNAAGVSVLNKLLPGTDKIAFNSQLLVSFASTYSFRYDVIVDTLADACLKSGFCIGCAYNLDIQVRDECGEELVTAANGGVPVKGVIGKVDTTGGAINFDMLCSGSSLFQDSAKFNLYLQPGVYTVSKILELNKDAKDFFVSGYLDTAYNSCVKTYDDFLQDELAKIDTMDCYVTCASCAEDLGTKDDFVSSGRGTAAQYDFLLDQCIEPCKIKTICETTYDMMLSDVSPSGQYGKYNTVTNSASGQHLSVFNPTNYLSANMVNSLQGNWHYPRIQLGGTWYNMYLDEDGNRTKAIVSKSGTTYIPPVNDTNKVYYDSTLNIHYTYPENLSDLADFLPLWTSSFARSLVLYHPEYAYYRSCKEHAVEFPADTITSDQFDSLLFVTNSFATAVTNGFIKSTYSTPGSAISKIVPFWSTAGSGIKDPFFTNSNYQYITTVNSTTGSKTSINMNSWPINYDIQTEIDSLMNNYMIISGIPYTMADVAAMTTRAGSFYFAPPPPACLAFGMNYYSSSGPLNDSVRDKEWSLFRQFYYSTKQKMQFKRMEFYAKHSDDAMSNFYGGSNCCIENTSYNPIAEEMLIAFGFSMVGYPISAYYDGSQPCNVSTNHLYRYYKKRFIDPDNTGLNTSSAAQLAYQASGQCPLALQFQGLINGLISRNSFKNDSTLMDTIPEFAPDLYNALNSPLLPPNYLHYQWKVISYNDSIMNVHIMDTATEVNKCTISFSITGTSIPTFDSIVSISQLKHDGSGSGTNPFYAIALCKNGSTMYSDYIRGNSCFKIESCSFPETCTPNQFASDMEVLFSALKRTDSLQAIGPVPLYRDSLFNGLLTTQIKNKLGSPNSKMIYEFLSPDKFTFYDTTNISTKLVFTIISIAPSAITLDSIGGFTNINSATNHLFTMKGIDTNFVEKCNVKAFAIKITSTDTTEISMGDCGLAVSPECNTTEHQVRADLEELVSAVLSSGGSFTGLNLFSFPEFSSLLANYTQVGLTTSSSTYNNSTGTSPNFDTLYFDLEDCGLELHHYRNNGTSLNFSDVVLVNNLEGIGTPDIQGNYYVFSAIATYSVALDSLVNDTIYGYSCFPIKNCPHCTGVDTITNSTSSAANSLNMTPPVADPIDQELCDSLYNDYLAALASYNASYYATNTGYTLSNAFSDSTALWKSGRCGCVDDYIAYLQPYDTTVNLSMPRPLNLDTFYCADVFIDPDIPCPGLYTQYLTVMNTYNGMVTLGSIPYPAITQTVSSTTLSRFCDCAKKYINNITALTLGASIPIGVPVSDYLVFKYACSVPICVNPLDSGLAVIPYTKYDNPCVQQMLNMAAFNAANNWNMYRDSMSTVIGERYTTHCLNALETFEDSYDDKEFHYTLYYYDQAGNLVRTIPPEGTDILNISSYSDPLSVKINSDRTYGTHSVYTSHRMATTYEYNSLNQLMYQSMPDHDNITLCDAHHPIGLDTSLIITSMQFVTPSKGYLCGYIKTSSTVKRGMMYTSNDGGTSWTRMSGMTSGNIKKVHFPSATTGYAVADYGLVYKTIDGGNTWDLLKTLYAPTSGGRYFDGLYDVFFKDSLNGVVGGVKTSAHQGIYYTADGGLSFTGAVITNLTASDTITSFSFDGGRVYATTSNGTIGKVFYSSTSNLSSWTKLSNFVANNLKKVQFIHDTLAMAVGEDGTLLRATAPTTGWALLPTRTTSNFRDIWFKNRTEGVALIDSASGYSLLYKTLDGGSNWEPLDGPGNHYNSLQGYKPDTASYKVMAVGKNGLMTKVLMNTPPFGLIKIPTPTTRHFGYADAFSNDTLGTLLTVGITANSGRIYTTYDAQAGTINWKTYRADSLGVTAADTSFKKILLSVNDSVIPHIKSIILTNTGKLYSFFKMYSGAPVMAQVSVGGSYFFTDITSQTKKDTTLFYAIDSISKTVYRVKFDASNVAQAVQYTGALSGGNGNIQSFDISDESQEFMVAGNTGHLDHGSLSGSTITWTDVTNKAKPGLLNKVRMMQVDKGMIVGTDGQTWYSETPTSKWYLTKSGTAENLTALDADSTGTGLIGTGIGLVYQLTNGLSFSPTLTSLGSYNSAKITHAAIDTISDQAYMTMDDGKMLYVPAYASASPQIASIATSDALNGVAFKNSGNAYAVGDNTGIFNYVGTSSAVRKELFNRLYISTHFFDANNGYIIDSSRVIRRTIDGGNTWTVILPDTTLPTLNKVFATNSSQGIIIGNANYAAVSNSNVLTKITVPGVATSLYDIDFNRSSMGYGVVVGNKTRGISITSTGPTTYVMAIIGAAITGPTSPDFRAVRVFNDSNFIAAGKSGVIYYHNGSSYVQQQSYTLPVGTLPANETFNDIFFHDDHTGYVVGDNGAVLKCNLENNISVDGLSIGNIAWSQFCTTALYDPYTTNPQIQNLTFSSIDFPTRTKGLLVGGDANFTTPFFSQKYARLINDQGSYYSTRFWYDRLGRMVLSQNTKQFNKNNPDSVNVEQAFSYTKYDALGRITEVGEKYENHDTGAVTAPLMKTIFGTDVGGFTNPSVIDDTKFNNWLTSTGSRREVTRTYYDTQYVMLPSLATQQNLRKRVATVTYEDINDNNDSTFQYATHYSYDIHGNVKSLWQENPSLVSIGQNVKRVDYDYDLISGKVNKVIYQPDSVDQFMHRYDYDADNRITKVETSKDDVIWEQDAKYFYYDHGPLARIEYGKDQVQGYDFAYTLQGWIKGVNSNILDHHTDMGRDGDTTGANPNGYFAQDAVGYSLGYYKGDYEAVDYNKWNTASTRWEAYLNQATPSNYASTLHDLYNGNITRMVTTISNPDTTVGAIPAATKHYPLGTTYWYDQLNRLTQMNAYKNIDTVISTLSSTSNKWLTTGNIPNLYLNRFKYDANGNIKTQVRYDSSATRIDSLLYKYENNLATGKLKRNRLYHVRDSAGATAGINDDIEDQGSFKSSADSINVFNNYKYDEIGNLVRDSIEGIDTISWTVYGKIKHISYRNFTLKNDLYFDYDPAGNRIAKHTYDSTGAWVNSSFYVRDAQGNVMSIYKEEPIAGPALSYKLQEQHLYGSSRLGIAYPDLEMIGALTNLDTSNVMLGQKQYELSNHLGNVLTTVSDRKIALDLNTDSVIDYYVADIVSANDYYPFGSPMYGRKFSSPNYRYAFNGMEKDDDVKGSGNSYDFDERMYDSRLGRWLSIDPLNKKYPYLSPYNSLANNPIINVDKDGRENIVYIYDLRLMNPKLSNSERKEVIQEVQATAEKLNGYYKDHGINVQAAVLVDVPTKNELDKSDVLVTIGSSEQHKTFDDLYSDRQVTLPNSTDKAYKYDEIGPSDGNVETTTGSRTPFGDEGDRVAVNTDVLGDYAASHDVTTGEATVLVIAHGTLSHTNKVSHSDESAAPHEYETGEKGDVTTSGDNQPTNRGDYLKMMNKVGPKLKEAQTRPGAHNNNKTPSVNVKKEHVAK